MKKFITKILKFLFPLILGGILMELLLRGIPNDYKYKKKYLDNNSNKIEILFMGNSHSYYGLNPIYCNQNCFNASHITQSLNLDLEILKKYEQNWSELRIVVLPISYFSFIESLETSAELWRIKNYIIYYGIRTSRSVKDYTEVLSNNLSVNLKRIESYYINGNSAISCSALGWGVSYNSKNARDLTETGKVAAARHTIKDYKYYEQNVTALKAIIEFGQLHNINIVLFTPPAYKTYVSNLNRQQLDKTIKTAETIATRYDNCIYFNLLEDKSFSESDFYDADHLNEKGAEKLTLLIEKLITDKF